MELKLSVVMPVHNEVKTVRDIIRRVLEVPVTGELVIVDDFSNALRSRSKEPGSCSSKLKGFHSGSSIECQIQRENI